MNIKSLYLMLRNHDIKNQLYISCYDLSLQTLNCAIKILVLALYVHRIQLKYKKNLLSHIVAQKIFIKNEREYNNGNHNNIQKNEKRKTKPKHI